MHAFRQFVTPSVRLKANTLESTIYVVVPCCNARGGKEMLGIYPPDWQKRLCLHEMCTWAMSQSSPKMSAEQKYCGRSGGQWNTVHSFNIIFIC
jgi:hypothetical protein